MSYRNICSLDIELIIKLHIILRTGNMADDLPHQSLSLFLAFAHDRCKADWETDKFEQVVRHILHDINIVNKTC